MVSTPAAALELVDPLTWTEKQREGTAQFLRALAFTPEAKAAGAAPVTIHRSVPQLVRALGLPEGPNIRATQQRYRNQIYRWVRYLAPLGFSACEAPKGRDGRGTGILIHVPAGVAQSVRAAFYGLRRVAPRLRRPSIWTKVSAPPTGQTNLCPTTALSRSPRASLARERESSVDALERFGDPAAVAATDWEERRIERVGPVGVAVQAWQEYSGGRPARLSSFAAGRLELYCRLLDRHAGSEGYALRWLVGQIEDAFDPYVGTASVLGRKPWDRDAQHDGGAPRSLGYFVRLLRRHYRRNVRRRPFSATHDRDHLSGRQVVDVPGGRRQAGVTQLRADDVNGHPLVSELKGVSVPEAVRMDPALEAGARCSVAERFTEAGRVHRFPEGRPADDAEQRMPAREPELAPALQPLADDGRGARVEADDSPAVSLPVEHNDRPAVEVDVFRQQRERFADPETRAPQEHDQRPVTGAGVPPAAGSEDAVDFVASENFSRVGLSGVSGRHAQTVARQGDVRTSPAGDENGALHSSPLRSNGPGSVSQKRGVVATPPDAADGAAATPQEPTPEG